MTVDKSRTFKLLRIFFERYFLPLTLGAVVMHIIIYTYMNFDIGIATAGYVVYECVLFFIFEKIKNKKILRGFIYIVLAVAVLMAGGNLLRSGVYSTSVSFIDWFYVNSQEVGEVREYLYFVFISLGFFITSIIYYFTVYRYRTFGMMLIILFPFVIYGKRDDTIPAFKVTLMLTVFLALMVHQRITSDDAKDSRKKTIMNFSYVIAAAVFVTFAGAVTMVVPKPEYTSKLENNSGLFDLNINSNTTAYDNLSDVSSPRFGEDATGEVLFTMTTTGDEDIIYLRRQSFDVFRDDRWRLDDSYEGYNIYDDQIDDNEVNSPVYVYRLMRSLAETGRYEQYGLTEELFSENEYNTSSWVNLRSSTYSPTYIPAPLMANMAPITYAYRNVHGEVYYDGFAKQYSGLGVSYSYIVEDEDEAAYLRKLPFDWNDFLEIIDAAYYNDDITAAQWSNITSLYSLYTDVDGCSQQMQDLAEQIVKGKETEYDKAQAFVDYFENNGFTYDLLYEPEDESIDYFLFESKTGSCTSYATSMVLMARHVGLPARYVEGFAAYERDENGAFVIRDSHAHAFVEVYIAGAGWATFDPTVSGYMQDYSNQNGNAGDIIKTFVDYFSRIVLFLGVIFVLVFIVFLDHIAELIFRLSLKFRKSDSAKSAAVYKRIIRLLELSLRKRLKGHTPEEISTLVKNDCKADVTLAVSLFEQTCFGGYEPTHQEYQQAYVQYKSSWKLLTGKGKNKKKKSKSK